MSEISMLRDQVAQLSQLYNSIVLGGKTNPEFPLQSPLDLSSLIRVSLGSTSFRTPLQAIISEAVLQANINRFIIVAGYDLDINDVTLFAGWQWNISGYAYGNPSNVLLDVPFTAPGKTRQDLIVANTSDTFVVITGTEVNVGDTIPQPTIPPNTLLATVLTVTEDSISNPTDPGIAPQYFVGFWPSEAALESGVTRSVNEMSFGFVVNVGVLKLARFTEDAWVYYDLGGSGAGAIQTDEFEAIAETSQDFTIPSGKTVKFVFVNRTKLYNEDEIEQSGTTVTILFECFGGEKVEITYQ